jgi:hypothetical protein
LNRRQPTKDDYRNFALYQANQKAYEATLLKNFLVHALHPERVAGCFTTDSRRCEDFTPYLLSVLQNAKGMADKMVWNAHCRAVNLLANDGKDGAPFLDVHQLGQGMFSDFYPGNLVSVVGRFKESWHRAFSEPAMVRMSTKQYPIGSNCSPLEEIDEIADKVFNNISLTYDLPTGRATKPLNKNTGKGRGLPGAALREEPQDLSRGNWLAFPPLKTPTRTPTPPSASLYHQSNMINVEALDSNEEPRILQDLRSIQYAGGNSHEQRPNSLNGQTDTQSHATRLENLYNLHGAAALDSDRYDGLASIEDDDLFDGPASDDHNDMVAKVPSWRMKLVLDHKRRLTERWGKTPQTLQRVLPGIKQVIAEAFARGYRPTTDDYHDNIRIIEAREQRQVVRPFPVQPTFPGWNTAGYHVIAPISPETLSSQRAESLTRAKNKQRIYCANKRQKMERTSLDTKKTSKLVKKQPKHGLGTEKSRVQQPVVTRPSSPHSRESTMLEIHQTLPPDAYFEPQSPDDKPAWRCGIKHAMGHYYNAGNRKACRECFTNIKDNAKTKHMDFYLPTNTYFFQPAPDIIWKPNKSLSKKRRSENLSHNSIAKDAYWDAIHAGLSADDARQAGIDAVEAALRPRILKEPTPEPTPEPEPDLGPHPSGSDTMEHGQDIPECAYFHRRERHEEFAWRCDVNHALGRYYLASDKRTCPGCGSNRHSPAKQKDMDFYMPLGVVVRQEAPELSHWTPRRPYKLSKPSSSKKTRSRHLTHNQSCSKKYFEAIDTGCEHEEAVRIAIDKLEDELEGKQAKALDTHEESEASGKSNDTSRSSSQDIDVRNGTANTSQDSGAHGDQYRRILRGGCTISLVPKKRASTDISDDETDDMSYNQTPQGSATDVDQHMVEVSSSDDETSGSDSE